MKPQTNLTIGISDPAIVDAYIKKLEHPLLPLIKYVRKFILSADKAIGEGIYWNAPTFYFTGKMKPFDPKEYRRYIIGMNFFKQDALRLILLRGASVKDPAGLLEGDYKDGRRIITFTSKADVKLKEQELKKIIKQLIRSANS
jgi:hypothetical protein